MKVFPFHSKLNVRMIIVSPVSKTLSPIFLILHMILHYNSSTLQIVYKKLFHKFAFQYDF